MDVNNITALQGLYVALGGDIADVANITTTPDMLEAIATVAHAAATELPVVTSADAGDILTVDETGTWSKGAAPAALPTVSGTDNGDVLTVVEGAWAKAAAPTELPTVTADDNGDVLTVVAGAWAKAASEAPVVLAFVEGTITKPDYMSSMTSNQIKAELKRLVTNNLLQMTNEGATFFPLYCDNSNGHVCFLSVNVANQGTAYIITLDLTVSGTTLTGTKHVAVISYQ